MKYKVLRFKCSIRYWGSWGADIGEPEVILKTNDLKRAEKLREDANSVDGFEGTDEYVYTIKGLN